MQNSPKNGRPKVESAYSATVATHNLGNLSFPHAREGSEEEEVEKGERIRKG